MLTLNTILSENRTKSNAESNIAIAAKCSPFFTRLLTNNNALLQDLLENLAKPYQLDTMQDFLTSNEISKKMDDEDSLKHHCRQLRQAVLARIIVRDIAGLADFHEVVEAISALAEVTIKYAIKFYTQALNKKYGCPKSEEGITQQLIVIGMGKLGGKELNVSSDIDLIFAYEAAGETDGDTSNSEEISERISNQEYFTKLGKKLISALDDVTEDGFVFRMDMRLRPFGSEGALVCSVDALVDYYQNYGREWERYAWIKGRVVAGPSALISKALKPFVFRKYLDYNAYASMRDLKVQIQRDVVQRGLENNIKLGRGGIREIEFIAQVFQLIRGGQEAELQIRPTLEVLALLGQHGTVDKNTVQQLSESYVFLRNLEHRLMYIDDQQTHELPTAEVSRQYVLKMMNLPDWDAFLIVLNEHRKIVQAHFDAVFSDINETNDGKETAIWQGELADDMAAEHLQVIGYDDGLQTYRLLQTLHASKRYQLLPEKSKQRFDQLMPNVIEQAAMLDNSYDALLRTINLVERVCRRASYLAFLSEFPPALNLVIKLCAASPWLTDYLSSHPILLDELIDVDTLYQVPDFLELKAELNKKMQQFSGDAEMQMDAMRDFKHSATLRFATQDIAGSVTIETLSDYLSQLAKIILEVSLEIVWQALKVKHIDTPKFAVIGYGKLGGKELGYMSDLDIIFLYQDGHPDASDIYAKYAQRINNWFNSITNAGLLYDTDLQLRPDGNSGLLVSSVKAFESYQLNKAWVWEHQAITRASFIAGDASIGEMFETIRTAVIRQPSDTQALKASVVEMRTKMREAKHIKEGVFDIKQSAGSIIDVEFIVQYLVLLHAHKHAELADNIGNIALLNQLGKLGIIDATLAHKTADAYREYRRMQHAARLQGGNQIKIDGDALKESTEVVKRLWAEVFN